MAVDLRVQVCPKSKEPFSMSPSGQPMQLPCRCGGAVSYKGMQQVLIPSKFIPSGCLFSCSKCSLQHSQLHATHEARAFMNVTLCFHKYPFQCSWLRKARFRALWLQRAVESDHTTSKTSIFWKELSRRFCMSSLDSLQQRSRRFEPQPLQDFQEPVNGVCAKRHVPRLLCSCPKTTPDCSVLLLQDVKAVFTGKKREELKVRYF